jgi:hypothetical protein
VVGVTGFEPAFFNVGTGIIAHWWRFGGGSLGRFLDQVFAVLSEPDKKVGSRFESSTIRVRVQTVEILRLKVAAP